MRKAIAMDNQLSDSVTVYGYNDDIWDIKCKSLHQISIILGRHDEITSTCRKTT